MSGARSLGGLLISSHRLLAAAWLAGAFVACRPAPVELPEVPEVLNSRVAFAPRCGRVFFSSNREGPVAPFELDVAGRTVLRLEAPRDRDLLVRSVSQDCAMLALVGDRAGDGVFDVYLYDLGRRKLQRLTRTRDVNDGEPEFAPRHPVLAYLSDGRLVLYDYRAHRPILTPRSPVEFTELIWSADGTSIFLEDRRTDLWRYTIAERAFRRIWVAPKRASSPRLGHASGDTLYFLSDHETAVGQIYHFDLVTSRLRRVAPSGHDQYSPMPHEAGLLFRTSVDGGFRALRLRPGGVDTISPPGVVYTFSLDFPRPLFVYAGEQRITSVYAVEPDGSWSDLLDHRVPVAQPPAREFRTGEGMVHFVFARDSQPAHWVVWLHGGPREQVSPRFNLYFDFLTRLGYAVVALNYPGSTGIGNEYELEGVPDSLRVERQLAGIDQALDQLRSTYPGFRRYVLVGVSYGSAIGLLHLLEHPEDVVKFVDFSGVTTRATQADLGNIRVRLPPVLSIRGANDPHQHRPARRALLRSLERLPGGTRVVLDDEGHYIGRMRSIRTILARMQQFLSLATS